MTRNLAARWRLAGAVTTGAGLVAVGVAGVGAAGAPADGDRSGGRALHVRLDGYNENLQSISTTGRGHLWIAADDGGYRYTLRYRDLEGAVTMAHLH